MATFEEQSNVTMEECVILKKPTVNDNWIFHSIEPNEADANLLASQLVAAPHNYAMAKVMTPGGNLYKDTE